MLPARQNEDTLPILKPGVEDPQTRRKPVSDSHTSTPRKFMNLLSGNNRNLNPDLDPKATLAGRGHENQDRGKSAARVETDMVVLEEATERNTLNRDTNLSSQTSPTRDQTSDKEKTSLSLLQEELQLAKDRASQLEEEVKGLVESQEESDIAWQSKLEEVEEGYYQKRERLQADLDDLVEENYRLSKELSEAREYLKKDNGYQALDKVYQTLLYERRAQGRDGKVIQSSIALFQQETAAIQTEAEQINQGLVSRVGEIISELQRKVVDTEGQVSEMREERDKVAEERDRNRTQLDRLVEQLAAQTSLDIYHCDDNYFKTHFSALRGSIKKWAHLAFPTSAFTSKRRVSSKTYQLLASISGNWDAYMYSNEHRPAFIQAFVWAFLVSRVFGGRFWEPKSDAQPFGRLLEKYLEPREEQTSHQTLYHEWRSASARLAVPSGTDAHALAAVAPVIGRTASLLLAYLEPWSTMPQAQSHSMLVQLVDTAVRLDLRMQQQRTYYLLWGQSELRLVNNGLFNAEVMEVRYGRVESGVRGRGRHCYAELVVAPVLLRQGALLDGKGFADFGVVEKAQVDVEVPPKRSRIF